MNSDEAPRPSLIQKFLGLMGYQQKLSLIFALITSVIIIISYYLAISIIDELRFSKSQLAGLQVQQRVEYVLEDVIRHKILSYRYHTGDEELKKELVDLQATISKDIAVLLESAKSADLTELNFKAHEESAIYPIELQKQWEEYTNLAFQTSPKESDQFHVAFVDNLQELLNFIGESSNLSYDYQPETHHLIQMNLRLIPDIQDLTSQLLITTNTLSKKEITPVDLNQLVTLTTLLKEDISSLKLQYQKSTIAESGQYGTNEIRDNTSASFSSFQESGKLFLMHVEELIRKEGKNFSDINLSGLKFLSKADQLWSATLKQVERLLEERYAGEKNKALAIAILGSLLMLLAALFSFFAVRGLSNYLTRVYDSVARFRDGDLTARAPAAYDTSLQKFTDVLNELGNTYEHLINQLQVSGTQLTSSFTQLTEASKNQQDTVSRQELTLGEILITAGDISTTSKQFAVAMNEILATAEGTSSLAALGKEGLGKMEESMHQMVEASNVIAGKLAVLNEKAQSITSVITTITKIADQTNLLSLNASIEAEKAGEQGRSFSVIAREIRRLADQTAISTLDIEKMITEMTSAVSEGVMGVDKFSEEIASGVGQVSTVSEQLSRIIEQVQQETASFESANKRMQSLSHGASRINESILLLNEASKETADSIRKYDDALSVIKDATVEMQTYVSMIKN